MIYSGYESGHYYVRLTHDMRMLDAMDMLKNGYRIALGHMLLLKKREEFDREMDFEMLE